MKKRLIAIFLMILLTMSNANLVFAADLANNDTTSKYVNYADLFTGKDKWENFNRKVFNFNLGFNRYIMRPVCILWASILPQAAITGFDNFYDNINYPTRLVSSALQGDFDSSWVETKRFFINLTVGIAGFFDPATTKFGLDARNEDMGQVLAHYNVKPGPYLVVPFVAQGKNVREMCGKLLNKPLDATMYLFMWETYISTGVSLLNDSTILQPITVLADTYVDPYEVSRQLFGLDTYLKNSDLDRDSVYNEKVEEQKDLINVNNDKKPAEEKLKADVDLENYNSQGADTDAVRTLVFDNKKVEKSAWSDISVWNHTFIKKLKISTVKPFAGRARYKFKYVLQKDKNAPLAIIYPPIGESIWSSQAFEQSKILYDKGFSVVILSSAFNWEFVKSTPENFRPGLPFEDAKYLREITQDIVLKLEKKQKHDFNRKILIGTSFGGLETLFVAAAEQQNPILGINKYIAINPPIDAIYGMQQIDKISEANKNNGENAKPEIGLAAQKVVKVIGESEEGTFEANERLPFTTREAQLATGYSLRQKLSDVVYAIESSSNITRDDIYKKIDNMSYYDYAKEYLIPSQHDKTVEELSKDVSMKAIENFLRTSNDYTIFQTTDDIFANESQLKWLKRISGDKTILFNHGSHLGYLYRKEFLTRFQKAIDSLYSKDI